MAGWKRATRWLSWVVLLGLFGTACGEAAVQSTVIQTSQPDVTNAAPSGELPPDPGASPGGSGGSALSGDCNTTSWSWPWCDIPWPSVPRFRVSGGRPDLTPKDSPWCRNTYIKGGGSSGWTYWILTQNDKYNLRFWPDYYSRYYQAVYWTGSEWRWLPVNNDYPNVIMGQRVYCDA